MFMVHVGVNTLQTRVLYKRTWYPGINSTWHWQGYPWIKYKCFFSGDYWCDFSSLPYKNVNNTKCVFCISHSRGSKQRQKVLRSNGATNVCPNVSTLHSYKLNARDIQTVGQRMPYMYNVFYFVNARDIKWGHKINCVDLCKEGNMVETPSHFCRGNSG